MGVENPYNPEEMRKFDLDPNNAEDRRFWDSTTPTGEPVDYSQDAFEFGGIPTPAPNPSPREAGIPVTRSIPFDGKHVPGAALSSERSAELQRELADIRWAKINAAGPGVIGGRPPEPPEA